MKFIKFLLLFALIGGLTLRSCQPSPHLPTPTTKVDSLVSGAILEAITKKLPKVEGKIKVTYKRGHNGPCLDTLSWGRSTWCVFDTVKYIMSRKEIQRGLDSIERAFRNATLEQKFEDSPYRPTYFGYDTYDKAPPFLLDFPKWDILRNKLADFLNRKVGGNQNPHYKRFWKKFLKEYAQDKYPRSKAGLGDYYKYPCAIKIKYDPSVIFRNYYLTPKQGVQEVRKMLDAIYKIQEFYRSGNDPFGLAEIRKKAREEEKSNSCCQRDDEVDARWDEDEDDRADNGDVIRETVEDLLVFQEQLQLHLGTHTRLSKDFHKYAAYVGNDGDWTEDFDVFDEYAKYGEMGPSIQLIREILLYSSRDVSVISEMKRNSIGYTQVHCFCFTNQ